MYIFAYNGPMHKLLPLTSNYFIVCFILYRLKLPKLRVNIDKRIGGYDALFSYAFLGDIGRIPEILYNLNCITI